MIRNSQAKSQVARDWTCIRKLCEGSHRQYQVAGGPFINETRPEDSYNLPFVLAYAVLDQVLSELQYQGIFRCNGWQLGRKMLASRTVLPWQDYDLVDTGKDARNELAHEAKLLSKGECLSYIAAIEAELKTWNVL